MCTDPETYDKRLLEWKDSVTCRSLNLWIRENSNANAEVVLVVQYEMTLLTLEVKSGFSES